MPVSHEELEREKQEETSPQPDPDAVVDKVLEESPE